MVCEFVVDPAYIINPEKQADEIFHVILQAANNYYDFSAKSLMYLRYFYQKHKPNKPVMILPISSTHFLNEYRQLEETGVIEIMISDLNYYVYLTESGEQYAKDISP